MAPVRFSSVTVRFPKGPTIEKNQSRSRARELKREDLIPPPPFATSIKTSTLKWSFGVWRQDSSKFAYILSLSRKRAEYGFGEYGFKHRTQWVFRGSLSSGERTQWVPLSLLFVCKRELTESFAELTEFAPKLSEAQWVFFSETVLLKQYSARFLNFNLAWKFQSPDPPTLAFFGKSKGWSRKKQGFSLRGTPQILGNERKNAPKSKGNRKTKKQGNRKKVRIGGSGSRLKISIPELQNSPQKIGVCWVARLKFSISIENFNPGGRSWIFSIFGPLGLWNCSSGSDFRFRQFLWGGFPWTGKSRFGTRALVKAIFEAPKCL